LYGSLRKIARAGKIKYRELKALFLLPPESITRRVMLNISKTNTMKRAVDHLITKGTVLPKSGCQSLENSSENERKPRVESANKSTTIISEVALGP